MLKKIIAYKLKKLNNVNFLPRQTISVNIDSKIYYVSLIADENFQVKVVLLSEDNKILREILTLDNDKADIVKLQNKLYVFSCDTAYIFNINNLNEKPIIKFLDACNIQKVCANNKNIFAYSIEKDKIIMYDPDLNPINFYDNKFSKGNIHSSLSLACNDFTFFSIPLMPYKEKQYINMKSIMAQYVGSQIASENDQIHSCTFNKDENTLYISMYNLIWIIKDGKEFSYLYFKNFPMTTIFYDNDIKRLIVNFAEIGEKNINGSIIKLSNDE